MCFLAWHTVLYLSAKAMLKLLGAHAVMQPKESAYAYQAYVYSMTCRCIGARSSLKGEAPAHLVSEVII